jgi:hypothetical protein
VRSRVLRADVVSLGRIAQEAYLNSPGPYWLSWERAADAVVAASRRSHHQRNGTPPWPADDDIDHECDHTPIRQALPMLTTGSVECTECWRIVPIGDLT